MFTGIVQGLFKVADVVQNPQLIQYSVDFGSESNELLESLTLGASVAVNGVCQTVVRIDGGKVWFDAIQETLSRTTLDKLRVGQFVNIERAAKWGDEIGGHLVSGHVYGRAQIFKIEKIENNSIFTIQCPIEWMKYFFSKGFVAINGVSLTLGDVRPSTGAITVYLIPETLRATTFGQLHEGDWVNIEFDSQTQTIVDTVERVMSAQVGKPCS